MALTYRNKNIDWENLDELPDFEEYVGTHWGSADYLGKPLPSQVRKDQEYDESLPGRKYWKLLFRDGDTPDYDEILEDFRADKEDWTDALENHAAAEGYEL